MKVEQIYALMNTVTSEVLGESVIVSEDLSNVVDIGTAIFDANAVDNYVRSLVDHIGKVVFVNRPYSGSTPSILMDGWEYGSILEKVRADLPAATENESWQLTDGASYDPNVFYKATVSTKFFNKRVTFEVPMSFTEKQVKESFSNATQLNGFISMLYNEIDKSMTVKIDGLIMRTINNMIGETMYAEYNATSGFSGGSHAKAVNLLYLYNTTFFTSSSDYITAADALTDKAFLRYAAYVMGVYTSRLSKMSTLFNIEGKARFTPADLLHVVLHADFVAAAKSYLYSDTYNEEFTQLPAAETVPYWQGSGTGYAFADTSKILVETAGGQTMTITGVLGIMFDRDALGVTNIDRRITTNYNPKAEFYNHCAKWDCGSFNALDENFVVFFVE